MSGDRILRYLEGFNWPLTCAKGVQDRCPEAMQRAEKLTEWKFHPFLYQKNDKILGFVRLAETIDEGEKEFTIQASPYIDGDYEDFLCLRQDGIWCRTEEGLRAGSHAELNHFLGICDGIQEDIKAVEETTTETPTETVVATNPL